MTLQVTDQVGFAVEVASKVPFFEKQTELTDTTNASTYTFTSAALGTARSDRLVVVTIHGRGGSDFNVSTVTIAGISATIVQHTTTAASRGSAIAYASVPTGTTGNIVVALSTSIACAAIKVYSLYDLDSTTPTTGDNAGSATSLSTTFSVATGSIVIGAVTSASSTSTYTWTNLTEDYDLNVESNMRASAASAIIATAQSLTVTATASSSVSMELIVAAFK